MLVIFIGVFLFFIVGFIVLSIGIYGDSGRFVFFGVIIVVIFVIIVIFLCVIE